MKNKQCNICGELHFNYLSALECCDENKALSIKKQIIKSLEEPKPMEPSRLVGGFISLLIASESIKIQTGLLKKQGLLK